MKVERIKEIEERTDEKRIDDRDYSRYLSLRAGDPREDILKVGGLVDRNSLIAFFLIILIVGGVFLGYYVGYGRIYEGIRKYGEAIRIIPPEVMEFEYVDSLLLEVSSDYEYMWVMGNYGKLKSVRLDGSVSKEGNAKVYLEHDDNLYLVFDSSMLDEVRVTGFAVGGNANEGSLDDGSEEISDIISEGGPIKNKSIIITTQGGGSKAMDDVFEFNVSAGFNWGVDYGKICTKWDVNLVSLCYGAEDCCALIGLESLGSWDDTFYLSYGRYDSEIENVVRAQVIYANYSLDVEKPYSDIVYSDVSLLNVEFYEAFIEFNDICIETCLLPEFDTASYKLVFIVENASLRIDNIRYSIGKEINVSRNAPSLIKDIENITVYRNGESVIDLSSYFKDEDGNELTYVVYEADNIDVVIEDSVATVIPEQDFTGKRYLFVMASDGYYNVSSNVFSVDVVEEPFKVGEVQVKEELIKPRVVINRPVRWVKKVNVSGRVINLSVNISSDALNVTVREVKEDRVISEDKIKIYYKGVVKNVSAYRAEKRIGQIEKIEDRLTRKKEEIIWERPAAKGEISDINKELLELQNERNKLTGYVIYGEEGLITKLFEWLLGFEIGEYNSFRELPSVLPASTYPLVGAPPLTAYAVAEFDDNESDVTFVIIEDIVEEIEIEYYTEGPVSEEENISNGKRIVVSSDVHYEDILAYTYLDDVPRNSIRLYHVVDGSRELVSDVDYYDENNNGLIDRIEWIIPSLSNETYELEIIILNVQSYPQVGGEWRVEFETIGTADLRIKAVDGTTWINYSEVVYDLRFLEIKCGEEILDYSWKDNSVFVKDYKCNETGYETSKVLTPGKHHLEFDFGGIKAYAHNLAKGATVQRGEVTGTGTQLTDSISSVNPNQTFILFKANTNDATPDDWQFTPNVSNSNTITFDRYDGNGGALSSTIRWQIIESQDLIVQRGTVSFASGSASANILIKEVNLSKAFVIVYGRCADEDTRDNHAGFFAGNLTSSTNLLLRRGNEGECAATASWQVVEWDGVVVQSGESRIPDNQDSITATINSIDISSSFLIFSTASIGTDDGMDSNLVQGNITSSTQLYFTHEPGTTYASSERIIDWYVVELPGANVQNGGIDLASDTIQTINNVNMSRTFHVDSQWGTGGGRTYSNALYTINLINPITLSFDKARTAQTSNIIWQVIEVPEAVNQPPTTPTNIQCNGNDNCNILVDDSVILNVSGSIDPNGDSINYTIEASLQNIITTDDIEPGEKQYRSLTGNCSNAGSCGSCGTQGDCENCSGCSWSIGGDELIDIGYFSWESDFEGWIDGGGDCARSIIQARCGSTSIRLRDNSGSSYTENTFDLTGYDRVNITWSSYYNNLEANECLDLKCDGNVVWTYCANEEGTEDQWLDGCDDNQCISLTNADCTFDSSVTIRFESEFSNNRDYVYIDCLNITGVKALVAGCSGALDCSDYNEQQSCESCSQCSWSSETEATKDWEIYNDVFSSDWENITKLNITLEISVYDNSGSIQKGNNNPYLELELATFDQGGWTSIGNFDISGTGSVSLVTTNPIILDAWKTAENRDLRIRGIGFDYYDSSNYDEINYTDVWITINGNRWTGIGNHTESTAFYWNMSDIPDQACIDLRARAIDESGSNTFSDYFIKGACLNMGLLQAVSVSLSNKLSGGIAWTVFSLPTFNLSAEGNNGTNATEYDVVVSAVGTTVDLYINADGDLRTGGGDVIGLGNETFSYNLANSSVPSINKFKLTTDYLDNKIGDDLSNGSYVYLKFFLNVPGSQSPGIYSNNVNIEAVPHGYFP